MSLQFPLYTTLNNNLPKKDLTIPQKADFIKKISIMDPDSHELVYALIKCYFLEHTKADNLTVPYNAQISKDKINFDLLEFPAELRQLLYKFVILYGKKQVEDEKLQYDKSSIAEKEK
jgi:hypothetical protein